MSRIILTIEFIRNGARVIASHEVEQERASFSWDPERKSFRLETATTHIHYAAVESFSIKPHREEKAPT